MYSVNYRFSSLMSIIYCRDSREMALCRIEMMCWLTHSLCEMWMGHSHKVFSYTNAVLSPKACKNRPNYSGIFSTPCRFFTDLLCCTLSSSIVTDSVGPIETGFSVYRSQLDLCFWSCVVLLLYVWSLWFEPKHSCWARTVESDLVAVTGATFRTTAGRLIVGTRHSWRIKLWPLCHALFLVTWNSTHYCHSFIHSFIWCRHVYAGQSQN